MALFRDAAAMVSPYHFGMDHERQTRGNSRKTLPGAARLLGRGASRAAPEKRLYRKEELMSSYFVALIDIHDQVRYEKYLG
jgi:hypothetical protein